MGTSTQPLDVDSIVRLVMRQLDRDVHTTPVSAATLRSHLTDPLPHPNRIPWGRTFSIACYRAGLAAHLNAGVLVELRDRSDVAVQDLAHGDGPLVAAGRFTACDHPRLTITQLLMPPSDPMLQTVAAGGYTAIVAVGKLLSIVWS